MKFDVTNETMTVILAVKSTQLKLRKMVLFYSDTGDSEKKNPSSPNRSRTYDLLVTSPDALPLSYRDCSTVVEKANLKIFT